MLSPAEFLDRFRKAPGRGGQQFERFAVATLQDAGINAESMELLSQIGLPKHVELVGEFEEFGADEIRVWRDSGMSRQLYPIGRNGLVSFVAIETATGRLVSISTDWRREQLVNSSLPQFAECLCLFAEQVESVEWPAFLKLIAQVDAAAALPECFWHELVQDLDALDDL